MSKKKKITFNEPQWVKDLKAKWAEFLQTPFMSEVVKILAVVKVIAQKVQAFVLVWYKKLRPIILFVVKTLCFYVVFSTYFGDQALINWGLAVVCALLPTRFGVLAAVGVSVWQACSVTLLGGLVFAVFVLLVYITVTRLVPEYGYLLLLVPVCLQLKMYLLVPVFVGLFGNPVAIVGIVGGVLMWLLFQVEPTALTYSIDLENIALDTLPQALVEAVEGTFKTIVNNYHIVVLAFVLAAVAFVVYMLNKIQIKHNRALAIWLGAFCGVLALIITSSAFGAVDTAWNYIWTGFVVALVALFVQWFDLPLDYQGAEAVTFTDENYQYQVVITPKDPEVLADMEAFTIAHGNKGEVEIREDMGSTTVLNGSDVSKIQASGGSDHLSQETAAFSMEDEDEDDEDETWESAPAKKSVVTGDLSDLFAKKNKK